MPSTQLIRKEDIRCDVRKWVCAECGAAFMSPAQATDAVRLSISAYQQKHGLLTADQIRTGRLRIGLSVAELADEADLGEATIKRLEAGTTVQRPGTNTLLLTILSDDAELPDYKVCLSCADFSTLCLPVDSAWDDEQPWNNPSPWESPVFGSFCNPANNHELALAG